MDSQTVSRESSSGPSLPPAVDKSFFLLSDPSSSAAPKQATITRIAQERGTLLPSTDTSLLTLDTSTLTADSSFSASSSVSTPPSTTLCALRRAEDGKTKGQVQEEEEEMVDNSLEERLLSDFYKFEMPCMYCARGSVDENRSLILECPLFCSFEAMHRHHKLHWHKAPDNAICHLPAATCSLSTATSSSSSSSSSSSLASSVSVCGSKRKSREMERIVAECMEATVCHKECPFCQSSLLCTDFGSHREYMGLRCALTGAHRKRICPVSGRPFVARYRAHSFANLLAHMKLHLGKGAFYCRFRQCATNNFSTWQNMRAHLAKRHSLEIRSKTTAVFGKADFKNLLKDDSQMHCFMREQMDAYLKDNAGLGVANWRFLDESYDLTKHKRIQLTFSDGTRKILGKDLSAIKESVKNDRIRGVIKREEEKRKMARVKKEKRLKREEFTPEIIATLPTVVSPKNALGATAAAVVPQMSCSSVLVHTPQFVTANTGVSPPIYCAPNVQYLATASMNCGPQSAAMMTPMTTVSAIGPPMKRIKTNDQFSFAATSQQIQPITVRFAPVNAHSHLPMYSFPTMQPISGYSVSHGFASQIVSATSGPPLIHMPSFAVNPQLPSLSSLALATSSSAPMVVPCMMPALSSTPPMPDSRDTK